MAPSLPSLSECLEVTSLASAEADWHAGLPLHLFGHVTHHHSSTGRRRAGILRVVRSGAFGSSRRRIDDLRKPNNSSGEPDTDYAAPTTSPKGRQGSVLGTGERDRLLGLPLDHLDQRDAKVRVGQAPRDQFVSRGRAEACSTDRHDEKWVATVERHMYHDVVSPKGTDDAFADKQGFDGSRATKEILRSPHRQGAGIT
jgi:hypothetical protein